MNESRRARVVRVDTERPLFICGVGRSGTSLLQSMLNAHPDVCFPPETHFFRRYVAGRGEPAVGAREPEAVLAELRVDLDFARAGVAAESLFEGGGERLDPVEAYRRLLSRLAPGRAARRESATRTRATSSSLPELAESFPGALILHVVRDPRDVLLSRTRAAWSAERPWWTHPLVYHEQVRRGRRQGRLLFGDNYVEVCYEELISHPEDVLYRICSHAEPRPGNRPCCSSPTPRSSSSTRPSCPGRRRPSARCSGERGPVEEGAHSATGRLHRGSLPEEFEDLGYRRSQETPSLFDGLAPILHLAASLAYDLRRGRRKGA